MNPQVRSSLIAAAIVVGGALLYLRSLDYVPPYLIHDEAQGALQAHAIATTGHDLSGRLLPIYFTEPEFPPGRDPAMIYWTAIGLQLLPFTEAGVRTPTVLVAVLNLALMFFAARALFRSTWAGVLAALLLALAPVHFIRGRLLLSPLYSIPFVLAWVWSLARFAEQPTARRLVVTCLWLALGMYTYLAAVLMMPLYLAMTLGIAARSLRWRGVALAAVTMAAGLLPMALWYATHPERNAQIVNAYRLSAGPSGSTVGATVSNYIHLYWTFFDPGYFFVTGDPSLVNSTRQSGLFPLAFVVLVPVGLIAFARSGQPLKWVMAAGFLAAPLVSVISGAIEMNRVMFAIPFTIVAATGGALALWQRRTVAARVAMAALLIATAWQFNAFHRGYMSEAYRMTAAPWFSGGVREALQALIERSGDSQIYVSQDIEWVDRMWRFYTIEAGRLDLLDRTTYFRELPPVIASNAKLICAAESPGCATIAASPTWRHVLSVPSIDGSRRYLILERLPARNQGD